MNLAFVLSHLNNFDYVLIAVCLLAAFLGLLRGLIPSLAYLVIWIVSLSAAWLYKAQLAVHFTSVLKNGSTAQLVAFILIVFVVQIVLRIILRLLRMVIPDLSKSLLARLLGGVAGFFSGVLMVFFIVFVCSFTSLSNSNWFQGSQITYALQGFIQSGQAHLNAKTASLDKGE
jgi:uncharacterized membrane protein required for colicin V production